MFGLVEKRKHGEAHRVAENSENHRPFPAQFLQNFAEDDHRHNFRDLADGVTAAIQLSGM